MVGCVGDANDDVWFSFTTNATVGQNYSLTVSPSAGFDPVIQVFSGTCGVLTSINCTNVSGVGITENALLTTLGTLTTYYVRVYDFTSAIFASTTTFSICVTMPPNNNNCPGVNLIPSSSCVNTSGTLNGASASAVASCGIGTPNNDIWFNFVATSTAHTVTVVSAANIVLEVFSGSCGGTSMGCTNNIAGAGTETVVLATTIGATYWIRVYDFTGTSTSNIVICVTTPPANNECTGAVSLGSGTSCTPTAGAVSGATQSLPFGTCLGNSNDDVWYSFVAITGAHTVTVTGCASFNAVVEAYSGSCAALTSLGCVNATGTGGTETLALTGLTGGTTYYVRVYDFGAGFPSCATFNICVTNTVIVASDCSTAYNICTNFSFSISPTGIGVNDIPALGTAGNPNLIGGDAILSAWGTDHYGCLRAGELNSTWWLVNIFAGGTLEFTLGGGSYRDWIMYPYSASTCATLSTGNISPIRCNWNATTVGGTGCVSVIPSGGNAGNFETPIAVLTNQQYIICFTNYSGVTAIVPLTFGGTASVTCSILPIELISFNGVENSGSNLLTWSTATEVNNDYFLVKKSIDAQNWETISTVNGGGNSNSQIDYEIRDYSPSKTINYYQLIQVDYDGHSVPSTVISIDNSVVSHTIIRTTNILGQDIPFDSEDFRIIFYSDGTVFKKIGK